MLVVFSGSFSVTFTTAEELCLSIKKKKKTIDGLRYDEYYRPTIITGRFYANSLIGNRNLYKYSSQQD